MPPSLQSADARVSNTIGSPSRSPLNFFLLVSALSIPFWSAGIVTSLQLLPGLPVSALSFICPAVAAAILMHRESGRAGIIELLKRSFDYDRVKAKVWYVPIVLLIPGANFLAYGLMRLIGLPLPSPEFPSLMAPVLFFALFIAALGEELGWSGYVTDRMQNRWSALQTAILLGLLWAAWHIVPLLQVHRSPAWIAWWSLYTVASRVLMVWLYNNTGKSVFAEALYHAISNLSWQLFPNSGSHWNPYITGLIVAFIAVVVTVVWGPRTLSRYYAV
jgi:membrane protease YdiL (CAAX protease family)